MSVIFTDKDKINAGYSTWKILDIFNIFYNKTLVFLSDVFSIALPMFVAWFSQSKPMLLKKLFKIKIMQILLGVTYTIESQKRNISKAWIQFLLQLHGMQSAN